MEEKYNEVLKYARSIYDNVSSYIEFSDAIFSPPYGKTHDILKTPEERRDFINTSQYKAIAKMIASLIDKFCIFELGGKHD